MSNMPQKETLTELERVLTNQKTVSISKLKRLLQALNLRPNDIRHLRELKNENKRLRRKIDRQKKAIRRMEG